MSSRSHIRPLSPVEIIAFELLLFLPLLLPPSLARRILVFPVLGVLFYRVVTSTTLSPALDWSIPLALTPQLLKAFDVYVLNNAEADFRRTGPENHMDPRQFGLRKKLIWAFELINTPRGVGWNWEVPYVCYVGTESRRQVYFHSIPAA